jgi:DNA-binding response OmpR family regulator
VRRVRTFLEAWLALHTLEFNVIVAEASPQWRDLLDELREMPGAPPFVLMSHAADDRLWAEALNLGAFDLLMKPLHPEEASRVLEAAARQAAGSTGGLRSAPAVTHPLRGQNFQV